MLFLNLEDNIPHFAFIKSSSGKILGSMIIFIVKNTDKVEDGENLISFSFEQYDSESLESLYDKICGVIPFLDKDCPSIKESFCLCIMRGLMR